MEVKVQESELGNAVSVEPTAPHHGQASVGHTGGSVHSDPAELPEGYADAYESSQPIEGDLGHPRGPRTGDLVEPSAPEGGSKPGRRLKSSLLALSAIGHALTSTVGSAERAARSVVERVRGLFQESRERADFMTRRNTRRLGEEPAQAADRLGSTPQAEATAETSTASPKIDPDLFKNL